jgi:uncharacterized protein (TIGR03435 family)
MTRFVVLVVASAALAATLHAQTPPRAASFEAASVKRARDGRPVPPIIGLQAGGRLYAPRTTLKELVRVAYDIPSDQVIGGPSWLDRDHVEVVAKGAADASVDDVRAMMRTLLADRFRLAVHRETRDLPVYLLEQTGTRGPGLHPSGTECAPMKPPAGVPPPPPPPPPSAAGAAPMTILNLLPGTKCASLFLNGWVSVRAVALPWFVSRLGQYVGREVIDRTGLTGNFDIDLVYTPDAGPLLLNGQSISGDAPVLSTAVREQLGLKLASTKTALPVVVIDRADPRTEN